MTISIDSGEITIAITGIALLKLRSELSKVLGSAGNAYRDKIVLPISALPQIEHLLDPKTLNIGPAKDYLTTFTAHASARKIAHQILDSGSVDSVPPDWLSILDRPQAVAVEAMTLPGIQGLCLFDEQGSGKTVMTIASFDILMNLGIIDAMIVVCPKSMITEWPKDISKFTKNKYQTVEAEGNRETKYNAALQTFDILVTNYEGVDVMLTALLARASTKKILLVVDESYYLKNSESVRSDKVSKLRSKCSRCFVLCGTPAPNSAHDLINQFNLADLGYTFGSFRKSKKPIDDWEKISQLTETRGLFIRRLKTEIIENVPEKRFHVISVELKGKQALMYEKARTQMVLELRNLDNVSFKKSIALYFQRRLALLQICSCPNTIDPTFSDTPAKYEHLDQLVLELISKNRKVVIWSFFKKSLDEIFLRYKNHKPVRIDGSVSPSARKKAVKSFQEDPSVTMFIGNPAAAGAGITLHAAYDAIYVSYSNQAAHYLQSLDRIHRRGQISDHVNYYLLACKGTIEETEISRLRQKEVQQHNLLGDSIIWPSSLDDALKELLIEH